MLNIYLGYDSREPLAWSVLAHSILTRATIPVAIVPLTRQSVSHEYTRARKPNEATEFSLTRFLVPHLSRYQGYSLFLDCDMLCLTDIGDLMLYPLAHPGKAVYVCQHDYVPKALIKMDGQEQTTYPRKNWSSAMLFDNAKCRALTPEYVNTASGLDLHRFNWLDGDHQIGSLPLAWNWLVDEYARNADAKILHYTNGGPWFPEYLHCDHAEDWNTEVRAMLGSATIVNLPHMQEVTV